MSLQESRRIVAFYLCFQCLVGPYSSVSLADSPGGGACDRHAQDVANIDSTAADPQYGPAETLIVPLDLAEVETRLSDAAVLANQEPAKLRLRLVDVKIYDQPAAGIRVFLDSPEAANQPYDTEPGYVETFAFFPSSTGTATGESVGSFLLDLDDAVARLVKAGALPSKGHKLTIIPIDDEGNPSGRVAVSSLELEGD